MYIVKAAIKYPNGEVVTGLSHYKIIALQAKLGVQTTDACIQGFVDTAGNFYDRKRAKDLALATGQVSDDHEGELYCEDLWPSPIEVGSE